MHNRKAKNFEVIKNLREDRLSGELSRLCEEDVLKGRMLKPRIITCAEDLPDLDCITVSPRFCVLQLKADGSTSYRPIDDFTRSGCNKATVAQEKAGMAQDRARREPRYREGAPR